jgi:hypothetical protein
MKTIGILGMALAAAASPVLNGISTVRKMERALPADEIRKAAAPPNVRLGFDNDNTIQSR